ncbi:MAG: glycogen/starch/alpha-glucan phosphorylase, partial [Pararhodobacter sp.]
MAFGTQIRTWFEGRWHEGNVAVMKAADHGAWLGSTVFDGARAFDGMIPDLDRHLARVNASAEAMMIRPTMSVEEMTALTLEGLRGMDSAVYIRPMYWAIAGGPSAVAPAYGETGFCLCLEAAPMAPDTATTTLTTTRFRRPTLDTAVTNAKAGCLYPNNGRMLPEALERWSTWLMGRVLPRHMQIIQMIDDHHRKTTNRPAHVAIVHGDQVHMGELAFIMASRVNGVSALHTELVKDTVFADLHRLHPDRIVNQTNGVTPRRWLRMSNPALAGLLDRTIGTGWTADLEQLSGLEPYAGDAGFRDDLRAAKRANKVWLSNGLLADLGVKADPDAMFDVQIKRI